jgi:hypothetical protein
VYVDPKAVERATCKLQTIKQGNKLFATYLADFKRTLLDAKGGGWPKDVKKVFLDNGISNELHKVVVPMTMPLTY